MPLSNLIFFFHHHPLPLAIARNGNHDVEAVERGFEGNFLVEIQAARDDIDDNPNKPLLQIFPRQRPNANEGKGGRERVGDGNARIGEGDEEKVERSPRNERENAPKQGEAQRKMANFQ